MIDKALSRRILVVEDNLEAHHSLAELLQSEGHQVLSAFDGISGLCMARQGEIDVLVCDIGLPGLDGLELLSRLRATPGANIPFAIAITGNNEPGQRLAAIGAGYGQFMHKPIDIAVLLEMIASPMVSRFIAAAAGRR